MDAALLYAGSTAKWTVEVDSDYNNAAGYAVEYQLVNQDGTITINAASPATITYAGNVATITVPSTTSTAWVPGDYAWVLYATKSGERWPLRSGAVTVAPDLSTGTPYETRSHVKKTLDALEALIEGRSVDGVESYSIRGRSLSRMPIAELVTWRDKYRAYYQAELDAAGIAAGQSSGRSIRVRFEGPR